MKSIVRNDRSGLTVLEVLFAIGIVLVGLVGIGLMVPFAARQANESYAISQAIASGESAVALANSQAVIRPTPEKPWQIIDDEYGPPIFGDTNKTLYTSFYELYNNNSGRHPPNPANPPMPTGDPKYLNDLYTHNLDLLNFSGAGNIAAQQEIAWLAVNRTLGTSFYLDPSFWGAQSIGGKVMQNDWAPYRRSRFPYYADGFGPATPRPLRISLHDSNHVGANGGWMKPSVARNTVTGGGGDIVSVKKESSSEIPHHRSFVVVGNNADVIQGSASPNAPIWSALVAPVESTQIFSRNDLPDPTAHNVASYGREILNFALPFFPEAYDLSIVVQRKRNLNEIYAGSVTTPAEVEQERIFFAGWDAATDEPHNSGSFTLTLQQPAQVVGPMEANIKSGDWLMLSRNVLTFYRLNAASPIAWASVRQKHKWFRVISVPSSDVFPLDIRVSGSAWTWTTDEIQSSARVGLALGSLGDATIPYFVQTSATVIPNVIHVYERTFSSSN
jgi:hypothetical protein